MDTLASFGVLGGPLPHPDKLSRRIRRGGRAKPDPPSIDNLSLQFVAEAGNPPSI